MNRKNRSKLNLVFDDRLKDEDNSLIADTADNDAPDEEFQIEEESFSHDDNIKSEFIIDNIIDGTKIMSDTDSGKVDFEIKNISHIEEQFEIPQEIDETALDNAEDVVNDDEFTAGREIETFTVDIDSASETASNTDITGDTPSQSASETGTAKRRGTNDEIKRMLREGQKVTVIAEILGRSVAEVVLIKEMMDRS